MPPSVRVSAALSAALVLAAAACDRAPATAPAAPSAARAPDAERNGPLAARYVLPGDAVFPEGVAYDQRTSTVYATSTTDGTVFRGDARDPVLEVFLPGGADGRTAAVGVNVDPDRQRLFVAGGATGLAFVYDARTGALLARLAAGTPPNTFINDVAVAPDGAAYFTDSRSPVISRVVEDGAGGFRVEPWLPLAGTAIEYAPGFNLNGIEATADGRFLFTVQSNTGRLFRVDTRTRAVVEVALDGALLTNGDGLLLRGATLYAVRNVQGVIAEVRLSGLDGPAPRGRLVGAVTDPSFRYPTTVDEARGRLIVVNSQFDRRGPGRTPERPFTLSVVKP
jgi:Cu-Zn family superoxide dismutase